MAKEIIKLDAERFKQSGVPHLSRLAGIAHHVASIVTADHRTITTFMSNVERGLITITDDWITELEVAVKKHNYLFDQMGADYWKRAKALGSDLSEVRKLKEYDKDTMYAWGQRMTVSVTTVAAANTRAPKTAHVDNLTDNLTVEK